MEQTVYPLADSAVLLLGATGGIGMSIAKELKSRGANVCFSSTSAEKLNSLSTDGHILKADLRYPEATKQVVESAKEKLGKLDVIINSTGVVAFGNVVDISSDAMEELFMVNTFIPIMLAKHSVEQLEAGGALVNISGVISEQNFPGMATYGASKAALRSFDEALSKELKAKKIRVLDARPPHTESGLADRAIEGTAPRMPQGLTPDKVAQVICDGLESGASELPSVAFGD